MFAIRFLNLINNVVQCQSAFQKTVEICLAAVDNLLKLLVSVFFALASLEDVENDLIKYFGFGFICYRFS